MEQAEKLRNQAAAWLAEGARLSLLGKPAEAEDRYLRALKEYQKLWKLSGSQAYAQAMAECCECLADLCMQQGNMHGADYYYAQILKNRNGS